MANLSAYARKAALDWALGGANPTRPSAWWLGLSFGTPTSAAGSEITAGGTNYTRATVTFGAAASPAGSVANGAVIAFNAATYASTVRGWQLWDAQNGGNMLACGLIATATLPTAGSQFTCANGGFVMSAV